MILLYGYRYHMCKATGQEVLHTMTPCRDAAISRTDHSICRQQARSPRTLPAADPTDKELSEDLENLAQ